MKTSTGEVARGRVPCLALKGVDGRVIVLHNTLGDRIRMGTCVERGVFRRASP